MMENAALYRGAGLSAVVALVAFVVSAIALGLFFGGAGEVFGPVNDVAISVTLLALILPMLAVDRLAGADAWPWLRIVTVAAIAGAVVGALGQLLLVVGVIDLDTSYITGGIGFLPVVVWIVALIVLALGMGLLPASIGWLALASLGLIVVGSVLTAIAAGLVPWVAWTAVTIALAAWMGDLATKLLARATA